MKTKGYALLELIIALAITALITGSLFLAVTNLTNKTSLNLFSQQLLHELSLARNIAMARDQDVTCQIYGNRIQIQAENKIIKEIAIPNGIQVSSSTPLLGFKGSTGFTKFAGTLTLSKKNYQETLTLGVGFGKVQLK